MTSFVIFFIILLGLLGKYSDSHVCTQSLHFQILKNNYTNLDCLKCKDVFLVGWLVDWLVFVIPSQSQAEARSVGL